MTRGERLLFGRVATWMGGVRSGYSAKTADPSTSLRVDGMTRGERLLFGRLATWMGGVRSGYSAKTADLSTTLSQVIAA
jgi:hypothetical protein